MFEFFLSLHWALDGTLVRKLLLRSCTFAHAAFATIPCSCTIKTKLMFKLSSSALNRLRSTSCTWTLSDLIAIGISQFNRWCNSID